MNHIRKLTKLKFRNNIKYFHFNKPYIFLKDEIKQFISSNSKKLWASRSINYLVIVPTIAIAFIITIIYNIYKSKQFRKLSMYSEFQNKLTAINVLMKNKDTNILIQNINEIIKEDLYYNNIKIYILQSGSSRIIMLEKELNKQEFVKKYQVLKYCEDKGNNIYLYDCNIKIF